MKAKWRGKRTAAKAESSMAKTRQQRRRWKWRKRLAAHAVVKTARLCKLNKRKLTKACSGSSMTYENVGNLKKPCQKRRETQAGLLQYVSCSILPHLQLKRGGEYLLYFIFHFHDSFRVYKFLWKWKSLCSRCLCYIFMPLSHSLKISFTVYFSLFHCVRERGRWLCSLFMTGDTIFSAYMFSQYVSNLQRPCLHMLEEACAYLLVICACLLLRLAVLIVNSTSQRGYF